MKKTLGIICANYNYEALGSLSTDRTIGAIPFAGRYRFVDFPLSNMTNAGIRSVGIITPYRFRSMFDHVGAGKPWSLDRKSGGLFILPAGTPDLLMRNFKYCMKDFEVNLSFLDKEEDGENIVITTANTIYNFDFKHLIEFHDESGADITMVYRHGKIPSSYVKLTLENGDVTKAECSKPSIGDAFCDIMVMNRAMLVDIIKNCQDVEFTNLTDLIFDNLKKIKVRGYEIGGYFAEIKSIDEYYYHSMEMLDILVTRELFLSENKIRTKIKDNPPTKYEKSGSVKNCLVSSGCKIEGHVENSIIFRGVTVEKGAKIKNSIVMQNCIIGKNVLIQNAIIGKVSTIRENITLSGKAKSPLVIRKNTVL